MIGKSVMRLGATLSNISLRKEIFALILDTGGYIWYDSLKTIQFGCMKKIRNCRDIYISKTLLNRQTYGHTNICTSDSCIFLCPSVCSSVWAKKKGISSIPQAPHATITVAKSGLVIFHLLHLFAFE